MIKSNNSVQEISTNTNMFIVDVNKKILLYSQHIKSIEYLLSIDGIFFIKKKIGIRFSNIRSPNFL